ncbi:hypothetical protein NC652_033363 [Populus alba x Populus x berolinensis]|nr:hypothetical protein NC652_033363 [Populus alba x Populus x berolinensis]
MSLQVWTPNVITLWEALLTVLQYGLLLMHAYAQDKRWPYLSLPIPRTERPEEWVPGEVPSPTHENNVYGECSDSEIIQVGEENRNVVDIFSIHSNNGTGPVYQKLPVTDDAAESSNKHFHQEKDLHVLSLWKEQFVDALTVLQPMLYICVDCCKKLMANSFWPRIIPGVLWILSVSRWWCPFLAPFALINMFSLLLESLESRKLNSIHLRVARISWQLILAPWRLLFAFVPPYHFAHGWIAFIFSLLFISGIAYIVTKLTDIISCVTGINAYVIAFTALASGTSWPDLVASKIAAERQTTADSAIANITCSNSVNIYVGIGIPWLIDTAYNFFMYNEPLRIQNAAGLSFSLLVFFCTSIGCIAVLVLRRLTLKAELGGPRIWAWVTFVGQVCDLFWKALKADVRPQGALSTEESCSKAKKDHLTTALEASTSREQDCTTKYQHQMTSNNLNLLLQDASKPRSQ